jgi:hypothetical protein
VDAEVLGRSPPRLVSEPATRHGLSGVQTCPV